MKKILFFGLIFFIFLVDFVFAFQIPQLIYHNIGTTADSETITEQTFIQQMQWLKDNNFTSCTFEGYYNNTCPEKSFILTIDDGKKSVYTKFKPIMDIYGYKGSIGIVTNWVGNSESVTWEQIIQLSREGWEITSHSISHPNFLNSNLTFRTSQYQYSRNLIQQKTEITPKFFVYPFNAQNSASRIECMRYYTGCTGGSSYTGYNFDYYLTENTNLVTEGLRRIKVEHSMNFERFQRIFNYTDTNNSSPTNSTPINNTPPVDSTNLILNSEFNGASSWTFYTNGVGSFITADNIGKVTITTIGNNMQLYQYNIPTISGKTYKLTFDAKSSNGNDLNVYLNQHNSPYASVGLSETFNLGTNTQTFTKTFTATKTESNSRLRIGFQSATAGTIYWIDNIKLEKTN